MNIELTKDEMEAQGVTVDNWYQVFVALGEVFFTTFGELPQIVYVPKPFYDTLEMKTKLRMMEMPANAELTLQHNRGKFKIKPMPGTSQIITLN